MPRTAEGTVRKLPSGRWQARYSFPDGVRRPAPTTFLTKRDANAWVARQTADVSRGVWKPETHAGTTTISFDDYAANWLTHRKVKGRPLAPKTLTVYRSLLTHHINPTFGGRPLHLISKPEVDRWYDHLSPDTPTQRAHAYALLRTILTTAVEDGHLEANPARVRGGGKAETRHEPLPPTREELAAIIEAVPPRYKALVTISAWIPLRFGEATELRVKDINLARRTITVRRGVVATTATGFHVAGPKSSAGRRNLAIPTALVPVFETHLREHVGGVDPEALLFPSRDDPARHLRQSSLAKVWYRARRIAGRDDLHWHDLRHHALTRMAEMGATVAELQKAAGHTDVRTVVRYQHPTEERAQAVASRLSDLIGS